MIFFLKMMYVDDFVLISRTINKQERNYLAEVSTCKKMSQSEFGESKCIGE